MVGSIRDANRGPARAIGSGNPTTPPSPLREMKEEGGADCCYHA